VALSDGIAALAPPAELPGAEEEDDHAGETVDPHVWFDPHHVSTWVDNAARALSAIDPVQAATYQANAEQYRQELQALDRWIVEQVAAIPATNRQLVTDHLIFSYFAQRYGFEQVGAVVPGYSTLSEPSAQELAALEDAIRQTGVKAILVGNTVNPALAERVAGDTGTRLVQVYTDSLTAPGGEAESYLAFMRYNVRAIVDALK
jgi:ABC-type Zn uptake system ZnuABC Zn-binding protein ZnuA